MLSSFALSEHYAHKFELILPQFWNILEENRQKLKPSLPKERLVEYENQIYTLWSYKSAQVEKDTGGFLSLLAFVTCVCQVKTQPSVLLYHNSLAARIFLAD